MSVTYKSNVDQRLKILVRDVIGDGAELVKEEAGLASKAMARWTPPTKLSVGRKVIGRDIGKTHEPFYPPHKRENIKSEWLKRVLASGDNEGINQFIQRTMGTNARVGTFDAANHEKQRVKGRVHEAPRKYFVTSRSDVASLNRFRKASQKKAGTFKSVWAFYQVKYGNGRVAGWIKKQFDASRPLRTGFKERLRRTAEPYIEIRNISHPHAIENLPRVMKARQRAIRTKIRGRLRRRAKEFSR